MGKYSTVLIHEATFDDELQGDAVAKNHSTTTEAIAIGRTMQAKRIILTHFSQRYQKIPVMNQPEGKYVEIGMSYTEGRSPKQNLDEDSIMQEPNNTAGADNSNTARNSQGNENILDQPYQNHCSIRKTMQPSLTYMKVAVAFDYMRVKVGEIEQLEKFTPALLKLYEKAALENDDDTVQRRSAQEVANIANRGKKVGEKMNEAAKAHKKSKERPATRGDEAKNDGLNGAWNGDQEAKPSRNRREDGTIEQANPKYGVSDNPNLVMWKAQGTSSVIDGTSNRNTATKASKDTAGETARDEKAALTTRESYDQTISERYRPKERKLRSPSRESQSM